MLVVCVPFNKIHTLCLFYVLMLNVQNQQNYLLFLFLSVIKDTKMN